MTKKISHKSHKIKINPEFIYAVMYRICTKCTLCMSKKKIEVMSKNGFQI